MYSEQVVSGYNPSSRYILHLHEEGPTTVTCSAYFYNTAKLNVEFSQGHDRRLTFFRMQLKIEFLKIFGHIIEFFKTPFGTNKRQIYTPAGVAY